MIFPRKILTLPWDGTVQLVTYYQISLPIMFKSTIQNQSYFRKLYNVFIVVVNTIKYMLR